MTTKDDAMKLALEALGQLWLFSDEAEVIANPAITALREALASEALEQPAPATPVREQEPVAWITKDGDIYKHECWPELKPRPLVFGDTTSQPAQSQQEPVLYQHRTRPIWTGVTAWSEWKECSKDAVSDYIKTERLHDWEHEVRSLYTSPAQRKPLTGQQISALWEQEAKPERSTEHFFTAFARAIEAAHGIKS